jgi:HEAT repeat protein
MGPEAGGALPKIVQAIAEAAPPLFNQRGAVSERDALERPAIRAVLSIDHAWLERLLEEFPPRDRYYTVIDVGSYAGIEAVPALCRLVKRAEPRIASAAACALSTMGGRVDTSGAYETLLNALRAGDEDVRYYAIAALGGMGPAGARAIPELLPFLQSDTLWRQAVDALGRMGPAALPAAPAMTARLKAPDPWHRRSTIRALARILEDAPSQPEVDEVVRKLAVCLGDTTGSVAEEAADALRKIGPAAHAAIPALRRAADRRDGSVGFRAQRALDTIQIER